MKHNSSNPRGARVPLPKFLAKDPTTGFNVFDLNPGRPVTEFAVCDGRHKNVLAFTRSSNDREGLLGEIVMIFRALFDVAFPSQPSVMRWV